MVSKQEVLEKIKDVYANHKLKLLAYTFLIILIMVIIGFIGYSIYMECKEYHDAKKAATDKINNLIDNEKVFLLYKLFLNNPDKIKVLNKIDNLGDDIYKLFSYAKKKAITELTKYIIKYKSLKSLNDINVVNAKMLVMIVQTLTPYIIAIDTKAYNDLLKVVKSKPTSLEFKLVLDRTNDLLTNPTIIRINKKVDLITEIINPTPPKAELKSTEQSVNTY